MSMKDKNPSENLPLSRRLVAIVTSILILLIAGSSLAFAQEDLAFVRQVQAIETEDLGLANPAGLAYSPAAKALMVVDAAESGRTFALFTTVTMVTPLQDPAGTVHLMVAVGDPLNMAFDGRANRLLVYQPASGELIEVGAGTDGHLNPAMVTRHDARHFGLERPQGMAVDPVSGRLFFLDSAGAQIVIVEPDLEGGLSDAVVSRVTLGQTALPDLHGLAFDPTTGHLYVMAPAQQMLYELTTAGDVVASRDLSPFALRNPQGMVFAPSGDLTDDPSRMSLYIADSGLGDGRDRQATSQPGGQIVELAFDEVQPQAVTDTATLVQVIDTSLFDPPSPDPAGITYLSSSGRLLVADSEVDEMPIYFTGDNLFEVTLGGSLVRTSTTVGFTDEPTGVTYDPAGNGRIFFTDDVRDQVYIVQLGSNGQYDPGDTRTSFDTAVYGSLDPEGITFDTWDGALFIADGTNSEVYRIHPGPGGVFGDGNDAVSHWDTATFGLTDPSGISFDPENGHLYIVGRPRTSLFHVTRSGTLLRAIDISAANAMRPDGVTCAPGSQDPNVTNVYVSDRRIDNNEDPEENDGKVFELYIPAMTPDVAIVKTVNPASASAGDTVEFTLAFSNVGGGVATGVQITDDIPESAIVQSWSSSGAQVTYIGTDPHYVWDVENLSTGEGGEITIVAQLAPDLLCGDSFGNTATIDTTANDTRPGNNSSEAWVSVGVDVTVFPATDGATADPGDEVIYTLEVTNDGECPDTFNISVTGASWPVSTDSSTGALDPGQTTSVDVTVTVPQNAQGGQTDIATVTFTSEADDVTSASSELTTSVTAFPGVSLVPPTGAVSANPGTDVVYSLYVRNLGNAPDTYNLAVAGNAWPTDLPPTVGPVAPGSLAPVDVTVSVPSNAQCGADVATVTVTSQTDPTIFDSSVFTTTANSVYKVTVIPSNPAASGNPGDPVVYHLRVTNTGNCTSTFDVATGVDTWITQAPLTVGPLIPEEGADVDITATVPQDAQCTDVDMATVTFTSQENPAASDSSQLTTSVNPAYGFTLTPSNSDASGNPGTEVVHTLRVTNLGNCSDRFHVAVTGDLWPTDAPLITGLVAPGARANVEVRVTVPQGAGCGEEDSALITLTSEGDGTQTDSSNLTTLAETYRSVTVIPSTASASADPTYEVVYSLWVQNSGNCLDAFNLSVSGNNWPTEFQPTVGPLSPGAGASIDVTVTVPEGAECGDDVATVTATSQNDGTASDSSLLTTTANAVYGVTVTPPSDAASGDPTDEVVYVLRVTNSGNCTTKYDIAVGGNTWPTESRLTVGPLEPGEGRNREVTVTVPQDALCGESDSATVTVTSQDDGLASDSSILSTSANAVYAVTVTPSSHTASGDPGTDVIHELRVTNAGNCEDTFNLAVSGDIWPTEIPDTVGPLAADAGTDVDVTVGVRLCTAGGDSDAITVRSTSQHDGTKSDSSALTTRANQVAPVANDDEYDTPEDMQKVVDAPGVLGNDSDANCDPRTVSWYTQPDNGTVLLRPDGSFVYTPDSNFDGDDSFTYRASDGDLTDTGTVVIHVLDAGDNPIVDAGADQNADEGETVDFAGTFVDPARTLAAGETIHWDFGDGKTATGTLTPNHVYDDNGEYTATLTITDLEGDVGQDSLVVTVYNVAPSVDAGLDQSVLPGEQISFSGSISDPGLDDTHTVEWDLGNGTIIDDTLTFDYTYHDIGVYTVTLTVTDDDGGVGVDTVEIRVLLRTYLPIITRALPQ